MLQENFKLIYTDDDEEDRQIFREGLSQLEIPVELFLFDNGISLVSHLDGTHDNDLPSTIICDMKMHMIDGLEVLKIVKQNPRLEKIPFIIFTTSNSRHDRELVMACGAEAFFTKPGSIEEMKTIIHEMIHFSKTRILDSGN